MKNPTLKAIVTGLLMGLLTLSPAGAATLTYADGVKHAFNPDATLAGLNVGSLNGDPATLANGDIWYDTGSGTLRARIGGASVALLSAGGNIGAATATSINGLTLTNSTGTLTVGNLKTLTVSNTLTLAGTDGATLNIGTGGTLGGMAYQTPGAVAITGGTITADIVEASFSGTIEAGTSFDDPSATLAALNGVEAVAAFATDNRVLRSDGTGRAAQASAWALADSGQMTAAPSVANDAVLLLVNTGTNGRGLSADSGAGAAGIGVLGSSSGGGTGVIGTSSTVAGVGVEGESSVTGGVALKATATDSGVVPLRITNFLGASANIYYAGGSNIPLNLPTAGGTFATQEWANGGNINALSSNTVFVVSGATPNDGIDDRPAIQAALDAAEAAGGGVVRLGLPGEYRIELVYDGTTTFDGGKTKLTGHYGLEIPNKVTLEGAGRGVTTLKGYPVNATVQVGCVISIKGARSADVAYECGSFTLADLSLDMDLNGDDRSAILVTSCHSSGNTFRNVEFQDATHHALEVDYDKGLRLDNCIFTGSYPGAGGGTSASWIQWDAGAMGPFSTHLSATAAPNVDGEIRNTIFYQRPNTDTSSVRDIDIGHGGCEVRGLRFINCDFYGRNNATDTSIVLVESSAVAGVYNDIVFDSCRFTVYADAGNDMNDRAIAGQVAFTTGEAQRWSVRNCVFNGQPVNFLALGQNGAITAANWAQFKGYNITDNTFNMDSTGANGGAARCSIFAPGLQEATIRGNKIWQTGTEAAASTIHSIRYTNTSGVIADNTVDLATAVAAYIPFYGDSGGAETACQAATIPYWSRRTYGNSSRGATTGAGHYYFRGANGLDGGPTYNFLFWGNTFQGAGHYDLAYQFFGSSGSYSTGGGQVLGTAAGIAVNFASMAAGAEDTQTVTVTGVRPQASSNTTATVNLGWSTALEAGIVVKQAWVSAADTVSIRALNTTIAPVDPASQLVRVTVQQF